MYEEYCSYRETKRKEELALPLHHVKRSPKARAGRFVGRSKLDTVLILFNAMQFNATKTKFHYRGSAFVAYVSYGSQVKKT